MQGSPVAIDLFAGAGGLSEGLLAAGINIVVALEKHPHPALTYAFNHPDTTVLCGEIRNVDLKRVATIVREKTGSTDVDLVVGGPPCQGYSSAGKRRKNDRRNGLYETFLTFVAHFRPRMVLFENVPGFADFDGGSTVMLMLKRFWKLGYEVAGFERNAKALPDDLPILDASRFGVPQRRRRFLLVAWRSDEIENDFEWPIKTHGLDKAADIAKLVTVKDALNDLAFLTAGYECHAHPQRTKNAYQIARRNGCQRIFNHLATKHRKSTVNMYRRLAPGDTIRSIPEEFRTGKQTMLRLAPSGISKAVLALPDDLVHYSRLRIPTVREMARLQSFDDDYVFLGKRTTSDLGRRIDVPQYTQVGNAVPPLLAKVLGQAIMKALDYKSKDLRNLVERQKRHEWLQGSSGFYGYTLTPDADGQIAFLDLRARYKTLPHSDGDGLIPTSSSLINWTVKPQRRSLASAAS